jgi:hypothetical protein
MINGAKTQNIIDNILMHLHLKNNCSKNKIFF